MKGKQEAQRMARWRGERQRTDLGRAVWESPGN